MNKDGPKSEAALSTKEIKAVAREKRLKAALRANLQRRKSQGRARDTGEPSQND